MLLETFARPHVETEPTLGNLNWLVQLRWVAVAGQLITIGIVSIFVGIDLPLRPLLMLVSVTAITNLAVTLWLLFSSRNGLSASDRLRFAWIPQSVMALDLIVLTGLLYWTGGLQNPFAFFYFVNLAISGLILSPLISWGLTVVSIIGISALLVCELPANNIQIAGLPLGNLNGQPFFSLGKFAYFVAFATCACVVTYFINVLSNEIRFRQKLLQEIQEQRTKNQRLEAMATLAAGAGHELATPLTTIAVVATELDRSLQKISAPPNVVRDVSLIKTELDHCRDILDRMKSGAGEAAAEHLESITTEELLDEAMAGVRRGEQVHVLISESDQTAEAVLPIQAAALAIRNLIQNAVDASPSESTVSVSLDVDPNQWTIRIVDRGVGIPSDIQNRLGEPFFTTKEPGQGMGLGIFLTRNVLQRLDGAFEFESNSHGGTTCVVRLPTAARN